MLVVVAVPVVILPIPEDEEVATQRQTLRHAEKLRAKKIICMVATKGGVEDTRLEAKDTKKNPRPRPRTDPLEAQDTGASVLKKNFFSGDLKKKVFKNIFARARVMLQGLYVQAYADDLAVLVTGVDMLWIRGMAQKAINIAANWASEQELPFISKKTEIVQFTHKRNPNLGSLSMNGLKLELFTEAKLLGVTLDSKLTWKPHITRITRKANKALMQCRQIVGKTWGIKPFMIKRIYTAMTLQSCRMHVCPGLAVSTKSI